MPKSCYEKKYNLCFITTYYFFAGSFTLNALSGKIMFHDIVYINYDYTLRIQDGYLIFRWWRSYVPKDVAEGNYCLTIDSYSQ